MNAQLSNTFALRYPVKLSDGTTVAEVTLTRAKGKALRKLMQIREGGGDDFEHSVAMLMLISDQPEELFDEMDGDDLLMLIEVIPDFFPAPPTTGEGGEASSPTAPTS